MRHSQDFGGESIGRGFAHHCWQGIIMNYENCLL